MFMNCHKKWTEKHRCNSFFTRLQVHMCRWRFSVNSFNTHAFIKFLFMNIYSTVYFYIGLLTGIQPLILVEKRHLHSHSFPVRKMKNKIIFKFHA